MMTKQKIAPHLLFNSYLLMFIVNTSQIGVGVMEFQGPVFKYAKQDSWIPVIIAGVCAHISIYCMIKTLEQFSDADLFDIHKTLFGKIIGNTASVVYIVYILFVFIGFLTGVFEIMRTYIFWDIKIWVITFMFLTISIYCVLGGVRVIAGFCFFAFFSAIWMLFVLKYPITNLRPLYYLPLFEHSYQDIAKGVYQMATAMAGFEVIYFFYPYVKEKKKAKKYAFLGNLITVSIYLYLMILSIGFFSPEELEKNVWVTLNLFKVVHFPFLEQFQVIICSLVLIMLAPNCVSYLWLCSKGIKKIFTWKQKYVLYVLAILLFIASLFFYKRSQINEFGKYLQVAMSFGAFVYPIFLLLYTKIYFRIKGKEKSA
jgi:spore germination protein AB